MEIADRHAEETEAATGTSRARMLPGRDAELRRIGRALDQAARGAGRLLVVEGEAGIGKTSLLAVARARAEGRGVRVLAARASELERNFGWGVSRQLFEPVVRSGWRPGDEGLLEGVARQALPVLGLAADAHGPGTAFAIEHGLYWLTANLADHSPVLLLVDDAHWADVQSLRFLHFLARRVEELPVLALVASRPAEPEAPDALLAALAAIDDSEVLRPGPLDAVAVEGLVANRLGRAPDPGFRDACLEATSGNPFLLNELLRAVAEDGIEPVAQAAARIPSTSPRSIVGAVRRRLAARSPEAIAVAQAVAILGSDAAPQHAARLAELDVPAALRVADSLAAAAVFAPERPLRFTHPIVREAVVADLGAGQRSLLHLRAARILGDARGDPDRIAAHLLEVEPAADPWVAERLCQAGRRALARGAPEPALALLRRALCEPPPPAERPGTLLELGRALLQAGDRSAQEVLEQALEDAGTPELKARCAGELGTALSVLGDLPRATTVLETTLASLPSLRREDRLALEAQMLVVSAQDETAARRGGQRIEAMLPTIHGRTPAERMVLAAASHHRLFTFSGPASVAAELAERACAGAELLQESTYWAGPVVVLMWADRDERVREILDTAEHLARRRGSPIGTAATAALRARAHVMRGELRQAEAEAGTALALAPAVGQAIRDWVLAAHVSAIAAQGRAEEALAVLDHYRVADSPLTPTVGSHLLLLARGEVRRQLGDLDAALQDAEESERRVAARGGSFPKIIPSSSTALTFHAAGRRERALAVAERELAAARAWGMAGAEGAALLVLGLVDGRLEHLAAAVERLEAAPPRYALAPGLVELGAALRRANRRAAAREPLRRGMDLAHRRGAHSLAARATEELRACGARPRRLVVTGADALTPSERRVARLAADGLSNPQIAQALFITRKTVVTHLGHAYRKLGISSRDELRQALAG